MADHRPDGVPAHRSDGLRCAPPESLPQPRNQSATFTNTPASIHHNSPRRGEIRPCITLRREHGARVMHHDAWLCRVWEQTPHPGPPSAPDFHFRLRATFREKENTGMAVKLRDHQIEAVAAIVRGLDIPPGGIPVNGLRGQVHAACGTGKTIIAAASAKRLVPKGRILVLVPTLDLLTQTVQAWRAAGHMGPAVAVCSLQDDPELWNLKVRSTTNPVQLALSARRRGHGVGTAGRGVGAYARRPSLLPGRARAPRPPQARDLGRRRGRGRRARRGPHGESAPPGWAGEELGAGRRARRAAAGGG